MSTAVLVVWCAILGHIVSPVAALCPNKCQCDELRVICARSGLNVVPITLNPRLQSLDLSDNQIKKFGESNAFTVYPHLQELDISRNEIAHLPNNAFGLQSRLVVSAAISEIAIQAAPFA